MRKHGLLVLAGTSESKFNAFTLQRRTLGPRGGRWSRVQTRASCLLPTVPLKSHAPSCQLSGSYFGSHSLNPSE